MKTKRFFYFLLAAALAGCSLTEETFLCSAYSSANKIAAEVGEIDEKNKVDEKSGDLGNDKNDGKGDCEGERGHEGRRRHRKDHRESAGQQKLSDAVQSSAENGRVFNWYCAHRKDGKQPECDPEMRFIEEHGGFYVDRSHSDSESDDKVIYLTFDAGYENGNVAKILDVLKEEDVPGAFFILENLVTHDTELVKRMANEGHTVCNHTARHRDMSKVKDTEEFVSEMQKLEKIYTEYTGAGLSKFYRPPEGRFSEASLKFAEEAGYSTIMWSFAYADWDNNGQMSPEAAKKKILEGTHNGMVILLHPTSATNAAIMKDLIEEWKGMGYRFGTMEELAKSGKVN